MIKPLSSTEGTGDDLFKSKKKIPLVTPMGVD